MKNNGSGGQRPNTSHPSRAQMIMRFRDVQAEEGAYEYRERGRQTVKLSNIVGSVNRYLDFDGRFRLKKDRPRERLNTIRAMMERGKPLPPVDLYKIKDRYFVLDGNHRISVAKERGFKEINARVMEFLPSRGFGSQNNLSHNLTSKKPDYRVVFNTTNSITPEFLLLASLSIFIHIINKTSNYV